MLPKEHLAILFDFDGVLAATMEEHYKSWKKSLGLYGAEITRDEYFALEGMNLDGIAKHFCKKYKIDQSHRAEIVRKKEKHFMKITKFKFYPRVKSLIKLLKREKIPTAIVSAAFYSRLIKTAPKDFLKMFSAVVSGDMTKRGKPFSDPYTFAAGKLGINIKNCIVVENSPLGVKSAKNAGAYCIAISSTLDPKLLKDADEIISSFKDLTRSAAINNLINRQDDNF